MARIERRRRRKKEALVNDSITSYVDYLESKIEGLPRVPLVRVWFVFCIDRTRGY